VHTPTAANVYAYVDGTTLKSVDPQGLCYGSNSCGSGSAPPVFDKIIDALESARLPVRFLKAISSPSNRLKVSTGSDSYGPTFNNIEFSGDTQAALKYVVNRSAGKSVAQVGGAALGTFYHESTHAFLHRYSGASSSVRDFVKRGTAHYANAKLADGGRVSDPGRVFQEAAAGYVGSRAAAFYSAQITLANARALHDKGNVTGAAKLVGLARTSYNDAMKSRVFGYEEGLFGKQRSVSKAISPEMKRFLDSTVLEGRVKDSFKDVAEFQREAGQIEGAASSSSGSKK
jgi:hypothetical protein